MIAPRLLAWYDRNRRDLPWRRAPSAWKTLVSELMLQQTVVATVVPYFERFVARFPDAAALAAAGEDEVLALWSGLGYYARARNLHRAARMVVERHGGAVPAGEEALRALPGVGPYTAAAVAAIAFGARTFALDGNAARVMARLEAVDEPIDKPATRAALRARGQAHVPAARAGDFAQAVMELGATVCTPGIPRCGVCPVARACAARAAGRAAELPVRAPKRARPAVRVACACVVRGGRVLLVRIAAGLLAGTWTLPAAALDGANGDGDGEPDGDGDRAGRAGAAGEKAAGRSVAAARAAARAAGVTIARVERCGEVRHIFTHRDVTAEVFRATARAGGAAHPLRRWVAPEELGQLGVSTFTRKTLRAARVDLEKPDRRPVRP